MARHSPPVMWHPEKCDQQSRPKTAAVWASSVKADLLMSAHHLQHFAAKIIARSPLKPFLRSAPVPFGEYSTLSSWLAPSRLRKGSQVHRTPFLHRACSGFLKTPVSW